MSFGTIIKELRHKKGITQLQLSKELNVVTSCIALWESDQRKPASDMLIKVAEYFGVSVDYLLGVEKESIPSESVIAFPVLAGVEAGFGHSINEISTGEYQEIPTSIIKGHNPEDYFVFLVKGDSMAPRFLEGDRVLVLRQHSVDSGDIAVVAYDGFTSGTIKKVHYEPNCNYVDLIPLNPNFSPVRIKDSELEGTRVIGKVVYLFRKV